VTSLLYLVDRVLHRLGYHTGIVCDRVDDDFMTRLR